MVTSLRQGTMLKTPSNGYGFDHRVVDNDLPVAHAATNANHLAVAIVVDITQRKISEVGLD